MQLRLQQNLRGRKQLPKVQELSPVIRERSLELWAEPSGSREGTYAQPVAAAVPEGAASVGRLTFSQIAHDWLERELLDPIVVKPKAHTTLYCYQHVTNDYLIPRWGGFIAQEIEPSDIEKWLAGLSVDKKGEQGLHWDTLSKIRSVMKQIYAHAQRAKLIPKAAECNPFRPADQGGVRCKSGTSFRPIILTPSQTLAMLQCLPPLERTQVILDASTGLRASEIAGLQWRDIDWDNQQIEVRRTWIKGRIGRPKSPDSEASMPMSPVLAAALRGWKKITRYSKPTDWVFASRKTRGRTPRVGNMIVADYLYPAAVEAGVLTVQKTVTRNDKGEKVLRSAYFDCKGTRVTRFGFHNFRHSLSSFLTTKKKTDPKTAQRMLRQSDPSLTLRRYTQTDMDELLAAQSMVLEAILGEKMTIDAAPCPSHAEKRAAPNHSPDAARSSSSVSFLPKSSW